MVIVVVFVVEGKKEKGAESNNGTAPAHLITG